MWKDVAAFSPIPLDIDREALPLSGPPMPMPIRATRDVNVYVNECIRYTLMIVYKNYDDLL